jgi:hypothetical protein
MQHSLCREDLSVLIGNPIRNVANIIKPPVRILLVLNENLAYARREREWFEQELPKVSKSELQRIDGSSGITIFPLRDWESEQEFIDELNA